MVDESAPDTSALDLGSLFGLNGIGDIGSAFGLFRRSLSGEKITADDIPDSMNSRILQMAMQSVGAETIDEFLTNPEILQQIVAGLKEDTQNADTPFEEKIVVQYVSGMEDEQLRELLKANPNLLETIVNEMDAESFRPMIEAGVREGLENLTVADALKEQGLTDEQIANFPQDFTDQKFSDLDTTDILGAEATVDGETVLQGGFNNEQLGNLVAALPAEQFNTLVLAKFNEQLSEDQQIAIPENGGFEAQKAAFDQGLEALRSTANRENATGLTSWFKAVVTSEDDIENAVFKSIRESIPDALDEFMTQVSPDEIIEQEIANFDPSTIDFENLDIDETFPPGRLKELVDANLEEIAAALGKEENWSMIESMVLANNGALIKQNRDRILDAMIPEMTEQGLNSFNSIMEQLPPQFRAIIQGFVDMFGGFLQQFGIDINTPTPTANNAPPEQQQEQTQQPPAEVITPPGQ